MKCLLRALVSWLFPAPEIISINERTRRIVAEEPHQHLWSSVEVDVDSMSDRVSIIRQLTGQQCKCGAVRYFNGPAYGWELFVRDESGRPACEQRADAR